MKDAFDVLGEEKIALAMEISNKLKGKTTSESLDIIISYMPFITGGKKLTETERRLVLSAIRNGMNETERLRLDEILSVLEMKKED